MQLGREKPQNLQMPLEHPVQNYTPLARWNVQLILKHLDLEELDFQGPIVIIYPVRSGGSDVIFFSLMCETYLCWTHSPASFSLSAWTPSSSGSRATRRLQEVGRKGWRFRATQQRGERCVIKKNHPIYLSGELRVNVKSKDAEEQLLQRLQWGVTHQFSIFRTRNLGCSVPESNTPIIVFFCFGSVNVILDTFISVAFPLLYLLSRSEAAA